MTIEACPALPGFPRTCTRPGPFELVNRCRKVLRILAVLIFAASTPVYAQDSGAFTLVSLNAVGSKRYEVPEILRASGLNIQQTITPDGLKEAAGKLGGLGIFAQVRYHFKTQNAAMSAEFIVQDAEGLVPCTFENFVWFTPEDLTESVRSHLPLFKGYVPQAGTMLDLISAQLVALLQTRGIQAQVEYSPQQRMGGIIESMGFREVGVAIPVHRIDFTGATKVDTAALQEAARPLLDHNYDASFIRNFSQGGIASVYRHRGYLRAHFGDPTPHLIAGDAPPNAVAVDLPVSEGEQYRLKEVVWSGESAIPYPELAKLLHAAVGTSLDSVQAEQDVLTMILFFHPRGYLHADVRSKVVLDDATHTAVYQIDVHQGDLFRLGRLEIAGMDDAHARTLEQHSRMRPGDPDDATYWGRYLREVIQLLPATSARWKIDPQTTIHEDAKTVDVRLFITPVGGI